VKVAILIWVVAAVAAHGQAPPLTEEQRKAQELLRQTVEERQKKAQSAPAPAPVSQTNAVVQMTQAEMEQQYLAGKITAKQFQQYLRQQPSFGTRMTPEQQNKAVDLLRTLTGKTNPPPTAATATKGAATKPEPAPEPATPEIVDVEGKIKELERLKEAREKSQVTNAPAAATAPKTKREKLDALLKQFVDGKLSEAEYKEQRKKIITGPD